jgi:hypothetical protein
LGGKSPGIKELLVRSPPIRGYGPTWGEADVRDTTTSMLRGEFRRLGERLSVMWVTDQCDTTFLIFDF